MNDITFDNTLTFEEHCFLRSEVGWTPVSRRQHDTALEKSLFITVVRDGGKCIGLSRAVGDGGYLLLLGEVIVLPEYQRQGIGSAMMRRFLDFAASTRMPGETVMINLMSAKGKEGFYEKFGFMRRPNDERGAGMCRFFCDEADEK